MPHTLHEHLLHVARVLAEGLDRGALVQRVTDEATRLSGAQFGAFFYNVKDGRQGIYTLYTLSGAPREAFSRFPMPRATAVFAPTFEGTAIVRSDDITKDPRYGKNTPRHGMPEGHLPVRSYLAVPVRSGSGDVLGGLFFGHAKVGVFTQEHEDLVVGIAGLAAPALENAHLHQQVDTERRRYELINRATNDAVWDWDVLTERADWKNSIHADDRARVLAGIQEVIDGDSDAWKDEYRFRRPDGTYCDILDRGYVIRDATGRATRMVGSMLDLSVRRGLERQLEASQERMRRAVEASGVGTWDFDPTTGELTWDERTKALFGLSPNAHVDYDVFLRGLHPDDRAETDATVQRALDPNGTGRYRIEYRTIGIEDGVERWINAEGRAFFDEARTRATRFIGTVLDITERKQLELETRIAERRFRTLIEATSAVVWTADARGAVNDSPSWRAFTGRGIEEFTECIHPDDREALAEAWTARLRDQKPLEHEYRLRHRDGTWRTVVSRGIPVRDAAGVVREWVGSVTDVTDVREAARALERAQARFRRIFESNVVGFLFTDRDGHIVEMNDYFLRLVGYERADLEKEPLNWQALTPPEYVERSLASIEEADTHGTSVPYEKEYVRRDGTRVPVVLGSARLPAGLDADFVTFVLDISARKRAETNLSMLARAGATAASALDVNESLTSIARSFVPVRADWCNIYLRNDDGTLSHVACAHADASQEEPMRAFVSRLKLDDRRPAGVGRVARTGVSEIVDHELEMDAVRALFPNDADWEILRSFAPASSLLVPLVNRGRTLGVLDLGVSDVRRRFTQEDIAPVEEIARRAAAAVENGRLFELAQSERRRAEEANRAKDEFLAVVSHELRTPLNAILGWAKMLESKMISDTQADRAIATIERNARAQAQLIEDLLDVSRIITGKLKLQVAPVDIAKIVEAALDVVRPAADAKNVRLVSVIDDTAGVVQGDADRLQQVVWNLLSNSVKFTPRDGRVMVRVSKTDSSCTICVEDTGRGIAREFLPRVFDPFRQDDSSTTRTYGGLGLGLAIVRHIAELHGGTVEAHSEGLDRGSTFVVKLPISALRSQLPAVAEGDASAGDREDAPFSCPRELDGLKIVIVDDEPDARELLASLLGGCRADVHVASSAEEALAAVEKIRPDILISDIGMPVTDGYTLIERVRKLSPERGGKVAAVALTAYARNEDRTRALLAGFNMHVAKPVDPTELLVVVANLAGRLPHRAS